MPNVYRSLLRRLTGPVKTRRVHEFPVEDHSADLPHIMDVIEWVGIEEHEVCALANFDRSSIDMKETPRVSSRGLKRFYRRQPGVNEETEFIVKARTG